MGFYRTGLIANIALTFIIIGAGTRAAADELSYPEKDSGVALEYGTSEYASGSDTSMSGQHLFTSLRARGKGLFQNSWAEARADLEGLVTLNNTKLSYFSPTELYAGTHWGPTPKDYFRLDLGRRLVNWSTLDEQWGLGHWQPRQRWNYFQPESVGLTGAFLSLDRPMFQAVAFATPVLIPETGATYELENGHFSSAHPFFQAPPEHISSTTPGKEDELLYKIGDVSMRDVVMNPGGGASVRVGPHPNRRVPGPYGQASYAYKPINQLLMGYKPSRLLNTQNSVSVELYPRIIYHHIGVLETGYVNPRRNLNAWVSVTGERPVRDQTPALWTTQELAPEWLAGSGVQFELLGRGDDAVLLGLGYLRTFGGAHGETGPMASSFSTMFETRVPYRDAASVSLKAPFPRNWVRTLWVQSKATQDFSVNGTLLSAELRYEPSSQWALGLGAQVIGAQSPAASTGGADFLYRYRSNDMVTGGVSYVF